MSESTRKKTVSKSRAKSLAHVAANDNTFEVLENITDAFLILDDNLVVRYLNPAAKQILERRAKKLIGTNLFDVVPEARGSIFEERYKQALKTREHLSFEAFFEVGPLRNWYDVKVAPWKSGIVVQFVVINERKQYEQKLLKTMESLAEAQQIASLGNWDWDIESNELFWSDEIYRIFGLTPQEFGATYDAFLSHVHPEDREYVRQSVDRALYQNKIYSIDHRTVRPDGSIRIVHEQAKVIFDKAGRPVRMVGTVQDVTDRKNAEQALEERLRFEQLLSDVTARFVDVAPEKVDQEINEALRKVVEFLKIDRSSVMIFSEEMQQLHVEHLYSTSRISSLPKSYIGECAPWISAQLKNGKLVVLKRVPEDLPDAALHDKQLLSQTPLRSHLSFPLVIEGRVARVFEFSSAGGFIEWTDAAIQRLTLLGQIFTQALMRKRAVEQSRQLRQELAHVSRVSLVGELSASLAHELNQPLAAILSNAQAAQRHLAGDEPNLAEVRDILADIIADDKRAGDVIRKMRGLLKKEQSHLENINLNNIIQDVIGILKSEAILKNVSITVKPAIDLPDVQADRVQIQQVLMNLILNAAETVQGLDPERRTITIFTRVADEHAIEVIVEDAGPGLGEDKERLFEPFYTTKSTGLGMGLSISRNLIEAHGGWIRAYNNAGPGASFAFTLPVRSERVER